SLISYSFICTHMATTTISTLSLHDALPIYYGGEKVKYVGESVDGDLAIVRARILTKNGTEVPVESRMVLRGDRWLIYDIVIENRSEEHTSELQSRSDLVCRLLLEKKKT